MKLLTIANNKAWRAEHGPVHEVRGKCVYGEMRLNDATMAALLTRLGIEPTEAGAVDGRQILRVTEAMPQGPERDVFASVASLAEEAVRREEMVVWGDA